MEDYSSMKRKELLTDTPSLMNLKDIMLSKRKLKRVKHKLVLIQFR